MIAVGDNGQGVDTGRKMAGEAGIGHEKVGGGVEAEDPGAGAEDRAGGGGEELDPAGGGREAAVGAEAGGVGEGAVGPEAEAESDPGGGADPDGAVGSLDDVGDLELEVGHAGDEGRGKIRGDADDFGAAEEAGDDEAGEGSEGEDIFDLAGGGVNEAGDAVDAAEAALGAAQRGTVEPDKIGEPCAGHAGQGVETRGAEGIGRGREAERGGVAGDDEQLRADAVGHTADGLGAAVAQIEDRPRGERIEGGEAVGGLDPERAVGAEAEAVGGGMGEAGGGVEAAERRAVGREKEQALAGGGEDVGAAGETEAVADAGFFQPRGGRGGPVGHAAGGIGVEQGAVVEDDEQGAGLGRGEQRETTRATEAGIGEVGLPIGTGPAQETFTDMAEDGVAGDADGGALAGEGPEAKGPVAPSQHGAVDGEADAVAGGGDAPSGAEIACGGGEPVGEGDVAEFAGVGGGFEATEQAATTDVKEVVGADGEGARPRAGQRILAPAGAVEGDDGGVGAEEHHAVGRARGGENLAVPAIDLGREVAEGGRTGFGVEDERRGRRGGSETRPGEEEQAEEGGRTRKKQRHAETTRAGAGIVNDAAVAGAYAGMRRGWDRWRLAEENRAASIPSATVPTMKNSPRFVLVSLLLALAAGAPTVRGEGKELWTLPLKEDAKWHALTGLGVLLVGTPSAVVCVDPETGKERWRRDKFKKTTAFNAREIAGTPWLLCNTSDGFMGTKFTLHLVDYLSGRTLWTTPEVLAHYMGTIPVPAKNLAVLVLNFFGDGSKESAGVFLVGYDLDTGKERWRSKYAATGEVVLHPADKVGMFSIPQMDLSGYHEPVIEGDALYLPYRGIHRVDLNTGELKWGVVFPTGDAGIKKAYAPLRVAGERIYGAGGGSVYAVDKNTGATVWFSERISEFAGLFKARDNAIVGQIEPVGDKVFARFGGNFSNGKEVTLRTPLGVVALDAATGKAVFASTGVKEGMTNLMVLPELNAVMFADAHHLYALDVAGTTAVESFRVPIEFKRKMGGGEVAQMGLGALGGITGLAKAGFAQSKARLDVPVAIHRRDGTIVVQGKQHLMAFDPAGKAIKWSTYYPAPGGGLAGMAMFALAATQGVMGNAQAMAGGGLGSSGYSSGVSTVHGGLDSFNAYAAKRAGATTGAATRTYVLTSVEDGKKKGVGLLGIDMGSGEATKKLILGSKEPDYLVDEAADRIFYFKDKGTVIAYQL